MRFWKRGAVVATAVLLAGTAACAGAGGGGGGAGGGDANSISVLMVNNPQMVDLQKLTADNFTKQTGITVNFTVLPENDVRDKISQEFSSKWVAPMDDFIKNDPGFDQADILKPMATSMTAEDGKVYGQPFYGESSFLMYRKDVFEAKGLTMPEKPTWQQVADLAAQADGAQPNMKGICLRGQPGWGQVFAPLTTVVNTFGGTWFNADWTPGVNAPEFKEATNFYVDLVKAHGENGAPQAGFTECLNNMTQGNVAMWYDATSAAGSLEANDSPVKGKIGYVPAPVVKTQSSGWLYAWAWGIQQASKKQDAAWKFISWASGKDYEKLVGTQLGWSKLPAGKRSSTYQIPEYTAEAKAFAAPTQNAIEAADPNNPGVQPRPAPGIQFVGIPEFPDLATQVSQDVSAAIAGQTTVDAALDKGQQAAETVASKYKK
jgi:sorbitol/mannitol transport system substrate-binding protein